MRQSTMIDDNGTCRILLWPETNVSAATYCVYDLRRRDCSHATKSLGHAKKLFRRWSARSVSVTPQKETYNVWTVDDIEMGNGSLEIEAASPEDAAAKHGPLRAVDYFDDRWEDHVGEWATILVQKGDTSPIHEITVKYM